MNQATPITLVTGATGALGTEVVQYFLEQGETVVGTSRKIAENNGIQSDPEKEGLGWVEMDVTVSESVQKGVQLVENQFGPVKRLIHCAGGFHFAKIEKTTDEAFRSLLETNYSSTYFLARELLPRMKERNQGQIIVIGATVTDDPPSGLSAYAASKAALESLVSSLQKEADPADVQINAVSPSILDTPANREAMPKADFSKWVQPQTLAELIYSMTSSWKDLLRGARIPVKGKV